MIKQKVFIPVSVEDGVPAVNLRYSVIIEGGDFVDSSFLTIDKRWIGVGTAKVTHWIKEDERYLFTADELKNKLREAFQKGNHFGFTEGSDIEKYTDNDSEEEYIQSLNIK